MNVVPSASSSASRRSRKHDGSGSASGSGQSQTGERELNPNANASTPFASPRVETPAAVPSPVQLPVQGPMQHASMHSHPQPQTHSPLSNPHHSDFHCHDQASSPSLSSGISYHPPPQPFNPHPHPHSPSDTIQLDDTTATHQPYIHSSPEYVVDELGTLRALPHNGPSFPTPSGPEPYTTIASPLFDHSVFSDPANFTNDVFLPGSAYEALHTALRNRQLWTARSDIPSRRSSPDGFRVAESSSGMMQRDARSAPGMETGMGPGRYFELSSERENVLWQNYLNEICLWVCHPPSLISCVREQSNSSKNS